MTRVQGGYLVTSGRRSPSDAAVARAFFRERGCARAPVVLLRERSRFAGVSLDVAPGTVLSAEGLRHVRRAFSLALDRVIVAGAPGASVGPSFCFAHRVPLDRAHTLARRLVRIGREHLVERDASEAAS